MEKVMILLVLVFFFCLLVNFIYWFIKEIILKVLGEKHFIEIIKTNYRMDDDNIAGTTTCRVIDSSSLNSVEFTTDEVSYNFHEGDKIWGYYYKGAWSLGTASISGIFIGIVFVIICLKMCFSVLVEIT